MSILVTTQSYNKDQPTEYGLLLEVDGNSGEICRSLRVETPVKLPDGRGRIKSGLRGLARYHGELYVTTWNSIVVVDLKTFAVTRTVSHQWMSDLHGIYVDEDGLWVTSTLPDALILYNMDGTVTSACWFSETGVYQEPKPVDKDLDWRTIGKGFRGFNFFHCNHVEVINDTIFVTGRGGYTKNGRIYTLSKREFLSGLTSEPQLLTDGLFGPHDGIHAGGEIWVTETSNSSVARISRTGDVTARYRISDSKNAEPPLKRLVSSIRNRLGRPGSRISHWTRGLAVSDSLLHVGQSTWADSGKSEARIVTLDRNTGHPINTIPIDIAGYPEARIFQLHML